MNRRGLFRLLAGAPVALAGAAVTSSSAAKAGETTATLSLTIDASAMRNIEESLRRLRHEIDRAMPEAIERYQSNPHKRG